MVCGKIWVTLPSSTLLFIVLYNLALLGLAFNSLFLGREKRKHSSFFSLNSPLAAVHCCQTESHSSYTVGDLCFQRSSKPKQISPHPSLTSAGRFGGYNRKQLSLGFLCGFCIAFSQRNLAFTITFKQIWPPGISFWEDRPCSQLGIDGRQAHGSVYCFSYCGVWWTFDMLAHTLHTPDWC